MVQVINYAAEGMALLVIWYLYKAMAVLYSTMIVCKFAPSSEAVCRAGRFAVIAQSAGLIGLAIVAKVLVLMGMQVTLSVKVIASVVVAPVYSVLITSWIYGREIKHSVNGPIGFLQACFVLSVTCAMSLVLVYGIFVLFMHTSQWSRVVIVLGHLGIAVVLSAGIGFGMRVWNEVHTSIPDEAGQ